MISRHGDTDILADLVVDVAGEDSLELAAGGQLQAVQGRSAQETLADDLRTQLAVGRVENVVRRSSTSTELPRAMV